MQLNTKIMQTYHKVITIITDRKNIIKYAGTEERENNIGTQEYGMYEDVYVDYFDTKEEAELFIRTQKKDL